jgi:broad specificity phosphatase PhoE
MQRNNAREVWFIRHAESVANAGGRTREAPTYPLSELGFRQAAQLTAALPVEPELIVVSPYVRAQQTAAPVMRRFPKARVEEWPVQEVQYLDPTLCVDTTQDERRTLSDVYWERCDPHHAAPGAESFADFIARTADALQRLMRRAERTTFIFCHGRVIDAVAWLSVSPPAIVDAAAMRRFFHFIHGVVVPNCAVLPLHFHADGARSLGKIWVPEGVEAETAGRTPASLAGL